MLYTAMLDFGFKKEKLSFKVYEGGHCGYLNTKQFFEDTVDLIKGREVT